MSALLNIENLGVEYRSKDLGQETRVAARNVSLVVTPGEVFGFLGPNCAGKTTTMNVPPGFINATSGSVKIFGVDVRDAIARQRLGYLPELTYYYKFRTVEKLPRFYARLFRVSKIETGARIEPVLKLVDPESVCGRPIKTNVFRVIGYQSQS